MEYTKGYIYYYSSKTKAVKQLQKIISEKENKGIKCLFSWNNHFSAQATFEDNEIWHVVCATGHARGIRWHKAYVETGMPIEFIQNYINVQGIYKVEDFKWF